MNSHLPLPPMKPTTLACLLVLTAACTNKPMPHAGPVAGGHPPAVEIDGAQSVAQSFYTELRRDEICGLPDTAQMKRLAPYFTPGIVSALQRASAEQAEFMRKHPDEKPPWIEGDLFSSLFEGVEKWQLGSATVKGSTAEVPVQLSYRGDSNETARWTDTLILSHTPSGWRVADIRMGGEWAFKAGGNTLSDTLSANP